MAEPASAQPAAAPLQPDPAIVEALVQMGFTENGSKRAAVATQVGSGSHLQSSTIHLASRGLPDANFSCKQLNLWISHLLTGWTCHKLRA